MYRIFSLLSLFMIITLNAQIIFSEDFDGIAGPSSGGAGTYNFPSGWLLRNVDNKTPNAQVAYVNAAWERREDFKFAVTDSAAFSTSWYSPVGASDDWMWTPEINLPVAATYKLKWQAVAYDPLYMDGYEVRIMTSPNTPTGGNGSLGNQVSNSTLLYSNPGENATWTAREVDISTYAGNTVRIAFRNNSVDKFLLLIDDVIVEKTSSLAINETSLKNKISVYPNPVTNGIVYIEHYKNENAKLFDIGGKLIKTIELKKGKSSINMKGLSGMYLLQTSEESIKLIVK